MPSTDTPREDGQRYVEAIRFATQLRHAEQECSDEVRELIQPLYDIVSDDSEETTPEERDHAAMAIAEALLPGLIWDFNCSFAAMLRGPEGRKAEREVIAEERSFADRVKLELANRGMTQQQLADAIGVNQSAISMLLSRKGRPQMKTVHRIAEAFGMPSSELFPGD
jgi:DNA-binding XRE family transcriptional regulator